MIVLFFSNECTFLFSNVRESDQKLVINVMSLCKLVMLVNSFSQKKKKIVSERDLGHSTEAQTVSTKQIYTFLRKIDL